MGKLFKKIDALRGGGRTGGWWKDTKSMVDEAYERFWQKRGGPPLGEFTFGRKHPKKKKEPEDD
jgi:hypothetical protein